MPAGSRIKALEQAFQKSFRKRPPRPDVPSFFLVSFSVILKKTAGGGCVKHYNSPAAYYFLLAAFR